MHTSSLEVNGRCIEGQGPDALPLVAEALLHDREARRFDMGVVRSLLDEEGVQALKAAYQDPRDVESREAPVLIKERMEFALDDATDGAVPALCETVRYFWDNEGLEEELGLELHPYLHFDRNVTKPTRTHIDNISTRFDDPRFTTQVVNGPISLSVRIDSLPKRRTFFARRLRSKHEPTLGIETHDPVKYQQLTDRVSRWHLGRDLLFTEVVQGAGDAVVFPAHPWPSMHSAKKAFSTMAALFDFHLRRGTV